MKKRTEKPSKIKSNHIKRLLKERELLQKDLAKKCGITAPHLSEIISGTRKGINLSLAVKIAKHLNSSVEEVFVF